MGIAHVEYFTMGLTQLLLLVVFLISTNTPTQGYHQNEEPGDTASVSDDEPVEKGRRFACPAGFKYDEVNGGCTKKDAKVTEEETLVEHLVDEDERMREPIEEEEEEIDPNEKFERPISSY